MNKMIPKKCPQPLLNHHKYSVMKFITLTEEHKKQIGSILIPLALLSVIPFTPDATEVVTPEPEDQIVQEIPAPNDPFGDIVVHAQSAIVLDVTKNEILFEKNADVQLPLASVTKLMTAYVAHELTERGNEIVITAEALREEGDSGLYLHERWDVRDLMDFTLLVSSNDGARAIASAIGSLFASQVHSASTSQVVNSKVSSFISSSTVDTSIPPHDVFVELMNVAAKDMGLESTYFHNASGLDISDSQSGAYGSARDMAHLISTMYKKDNHMLDATKYTELSFTSIDELPHGATNTNDVLANLPNVLGSKTGYTDLAGGNLVVLIDAGINYPIAIAVLGSTYDKRFSDVELLAWKALERIAQ